MIIVFLIFDIDTLSQYILRLTEMHKFAYSSRPIIFMIPNEISCWFIIWTYWRIILGSHFTFRETTAQSQSTTILFLFSLVVSTSVLVLCHSLYCLILLCIVLFQQKRWGNRTICYFSQFYLIEITYICTVRI